MIEIVASYTARRDVDVATASGATTEVALIAGATINVVSDSPTGAAAAHAAEIAAKGYRDEAEAAALTASQDADSAHADAIQTAADREQTGLDRAQSYAAATTATTQAGIATTQAGEAMAKASDAAISAANAAASASTATTKASDAATSASNAATSEASALSSKNTATTKASEASISAANAATSEANALSSKSTATTKASEAATSASNAATSEANALSSKNDAATSATNAANSAAAANTSAGSASGSASLALAIYGSTAAQQAAVATAQAQASLAAGYAASASSAVQQDLSGITAQALHRSPNAVSAMFIYDTIKDSDGGAWTEKCQHTSWYNEALNGLWLGAQSSDANARAVSGATTGSYYQKTTDGKFYAINKNLLLNTATLGTQTVWLAAGSYTLSSTTASSGSVAISGAATASHTAGGSATTFTVATSGNVTFTVTGSVTTAQCEPGSSATAYAANTSTLVTEVFRGNKAKFPKLAGIVAEAGNVNIYDLTEKSANGSFPMWRRFVPVDAGSSYALQFWRSFSGISASSIACINGKVAVGTNGADGQNSIMVFDLAADQLYRHGQYYSGVLASPVAACKPGWLASPYSKILPNIIHNAVNSVAMTVLPDAPVDPVTGLAVPTIDVFTAGGQSRIQHNGVVVSATNISNMHKGGQTGRKRQIQTSFDGVRVSNSLSDASGNPLFRNSGYGWIAGCVHYLGLQVAASAFAVSGNKFGVAQAFPLNFITINDAAQGGAVANHISNLYNTGHLIGDIRRAYLSDITAESVSGTELVTNGTFDTDATGWTALAGATLSSVSGVGRVTIGAVNSGLYRDVSVVAGKTYIISGWFDRTNLSNAGNGIALGVFGNLAGVPTYPRTNFSTYTANTGYFVEVFTASYTETASILCRTTGSYGGSPSGYFSIDNISVRECSADRSCKAQGAPVTGTLTKSQVATGASLVAYSGFSAANYLREPYSADLDFGTGEWSVGAWVNVPAVPVSPAVAANSLTGPELAPGGGTFDSATGYALGESWTISGGVASHAVGTGYSNLTVNANLTVGKSYLVSYDMVAISGLVTTAGGSYYAGTDSSATTTGRKTFVYTAAQTVLYLQATSGSVTCTIDNLSIREILPLSIASRSYSSGQSINFAVMANGSLTATAYDGTTTRTVTTSSTYNAATWCKAEAVYKTDGSLAILVNGNEVAVTRGNPLLTLNNSNAVLTIGNSYDLVAPFPGSIALLKLSATAPTYDQALWMYEQEKHMFRAGAQCVLPDSGNIVDLAYDDAADKWIAVSAANESEWTGLVRTKVTPVPAGSYSKVSAGSGIKLEARTTTNPGVDVTIPAYGLREEIKKTSEASGRLARTQVTLDYVGGFTATTVSGNTAITSVAGLSYPSQTTIIGATVTGSGIPASTTVVGISGTTIYLSKAATASASNVQISFTDFVLPLGYEAKSVLSAGSFKQEGSTKDWTRLFDGFRETIRFGAAPGYTAWVQINAIRSTT